MGRLSSRADWAWRRVRAGLTGTGPCHAGSSFQGRLNPLDGERGEADRGKKLSHFFNYKLIKISDQKKMVRELKKTFLQRRHIDVQ